MPEAVGQPAAPAGAAAFYPAMPTQLPLPRDPVVKAADNEEVPVPWIENWLPFWSDCRCGAGWRRGPEDQKAPPAALSRGRGGGLYPVGGLEPDDEEDEDLDGLSPPAWALDFQLPTLPLPLAAGTANQAGRACFQTATSSSEASKCRLDGSFGQSVREAATSVPSEASTRIPPSLPLPACSTGSRTVRCALGVAVEAALPPMTDDLECGGEGGVFVSEGSTDCGNLPPSDTSEAPPDLEVLAANPWPHRVVVASVAGLSAGALAAAAVGAFPVAAAAGSLGFALGILSSVLGIRVGRWVG